MLSTHFAFLCLSTGRSSCECRVLQCYRGNRLMRWYSHRYSAQELECLTEVFSPIKSAKLHAAVSSCLNFCMGRYLLRRIFSLFKMYWTLLAHLHLCCMENNIFFQCSLCFAVLSFFLQRHPRYYKPRHVTQLFCNKEAQPNGSRINSIRFMVFVTTTTIYPQWFAHL